VVPVWFYDSIDVVVVVILFLFLLRTSVPLLS